MHPANKGIIQLSVFFVLLLILLIVSYYELIPPEKKRDHCLQLVFPPSSKQANPHNGSNDPYKICDIQKIRRYQTLHLSTHSKENREVFLECRSKIHFLVCSKDTAQGIHLTIDDKTSWQDFISVLDICKEERLKTYWVGDNDIWFIYPKRINDLYVPNPDYIQPGLMPCL